MDEKIGLSKVPQVGQPLSPSEAMCLAINEGKKGAGFVSPNPLVGCTIVDREHRFLAVGFHGQLGSDHAEVDAIKKVADSSQLSGAHYYVTLEPCAHQGRTPSCAKTIAPLKPASLTYAVEDPNPLVRGKGAAILKESGAKVYLLSEREDISPQERNELIEDAEDLAEIFLHNMRTGEPFISVKVASTLDGKMALTSGESKWITGEKAREHVHLLRVRYDAVAIGRNTFVADDPSLNVRHAKYPQFENKAVVFDPSGRTLMAMAESNLLKARDGSAVFIVTGTAEITMPANLPDIQILRVPLKEDGQFEVKELLSSLKSAGLHSLMVEGGAYSFGYFFNERKVNRLHLFQAPTLLGGQHGLAWSQHFGVDQMSHQVRVERIKTERFGPDSYWSGRVKFSSV